EEFVKELLRKDKISNTIMEIVLERYHNFAEVKKTLEERLKLLREVIDKFLPNGTFIFGEYEVSKSEYVRRKLNTKALKEYLGEKYHQFEEEQPVTRIQVKKR
ncbi:MAG: hypothetical protein ACXQTW_00810, partial [Candidatus Methanospirareceae archaeon]